MQRRAEADPLVEAAREPERPGPGPAFGDYCIVGMENSAPSLMPEGQRDVTVFVLV